MSKINPQKSCAFPPLQVIRSNQRRAPAACLAWLILLTFCFLDFQPVHAQTPAPVPTPFQVIEAVNAYRARVGLFPLQANTLLMGVSQGQSDYMAVSGGCTHTGPDGSRPIDRVYASGFSVGQIIFVSENILCMPVEAGLTASDVVKGWADMDELHKGTLTKEQYRNIGAGVTELDGTVYYVIDVAVVAGGKMPTFTPKAPNMTPDPNSTVDPNATQTPAAISQWIIPVRTATPRVDGSQVHTVQSGQALWSIAIAYGVKIAQIVQLNLLVGDPPTIYIGQQLLVRGPALTPTVYPSLSVGLEEVTATPRPARTKKPLPSLAAPVTSSPTGSPTAAPASYFSSSRKSVGVALVILCALGLLLVVLFARRNN